MKLLDDRVFIIFGILGGVGPFHFDRDAI
jgi:hypothetical protein